MSQTISGHSSEEWRRIFESLRAFWAHDGNLRRPHALLTGGMHSDVFFNGRMISADEPLLRKVASALVDKFLDYVDDLREVDRVVGPQTGAARLAEYMADDIGRRRGYICAWASPTKSGDGKRMVFDDVSRMVLHGEQVLLCEDVITTGRSLTLTSDAVGAAGGSPWAFACALVNQYGSDEMEDEFFLLSLVDRHANRWTPEECPLCKAGSRAVRPKGNWDAFTRAY